MVKVLLLKELYSLQDNVFTSTLTNDPTPFILKEYLLLKFAIHIITKNFFAIL